MCTTVMVLQSGCVEPTRRYFQAFSLQSDLLGVNLAEIDFRFAFCRGLCFRRHDALPDTIPRDVAIRELLLANEQLGQTARRLSATEKALRRSSADTLHTNTSKMLAQHTLQPASHTLASVCEWAVAPVARQDAPSTNPDGATTQKAGHRRSFGLHILVRSILWLQFLTVIFDRVSDSPPAPCFIANRCVRVAELTYSPHTLASADLGRRRVLTHCIRLYPRCYPSLAS